MAPRTSPDKVARDGFANGSAAFAVGSVLVALSTGPLESQPSFPLTPAQSVELASMHNAVPEASRLDGLTALKDERVAFFARIGDVCVDDKGKSVPPEDASSWSHRDVPSGKGDGTFDRTLTRYTAFDCGDRRWELQGEDARHTFETPRGISHLASWSVPVDPSAIAMVKTPPAEGK